MTTKIDLNKLSKVEIVSEMNRIFQGEMRKTLLKIYNLTLNDYLTTDDLVEISLRYGIDNLEELYYNLLESNKGDDI